MFLPCRRWLDLTLAVNTWNVLQVCPFLDPGPKVVTGARGQEDPGPVSRAAQMSLALGLLRWRSSERETRVSRCSPAGRCWCFSISSPMVEGSELSCPTGFLSTCYMSGPVKWLWTRWTRSLFPMRGRGTSTGHHLRVQRVGSVQGGLMAGGMKGQGCLWTLLSHLSSLDLRVSVCLKKKQDWKPRVGKYMVFFTYMTQGKYPSIWGLRILYWWAFVLLLWFVWGKLFLFL